MLIILWGCTLTSRLKTDEGVYPFPYLNHLYHDYRYRLYNDDFWYYDNYFPYYYWLYYPEDNNSQPLKEKLKQIREKIKNFR